MGNQGSKAETNNQDDINKYLLQMDLIAANYATTLNLHQMSHLTNQDFCNNLTIISSDSIAKNLSSSEISFLQQRLEKGIPIDKMTKDKIVYYKNQELDTKNPTKKRRMCIGIAEFYIKLSHIYAAIFKTIQPTYVYKDSNGELINFSLEDKKKIPSGVKYQTTYVNFCNQRLQALINKNEYTENDEFVDVEPKFCNINLNENNGTTKNLSQLTGMLEFEKLFNDVYDYDKGVFNKRSSEMNKEYQEVLQVFYKTFTGINDKMPDTIKSFKDITLKDYHEGKGCKVDGTLKKKVSGSLKTKVFKDFAVQLKTMFDNSNQNQSKILDIIGELFSFIKDETTGKENVIVQPKLTKKTLEEIGQKTRKLIQEMYVQCEKDFFDAILKYQAIIIHQGKELQEKQIKNLEQSIDETINE